jgi:hypothetical protein
MCKLFPMKELNFIPHYLGFGRLRLQKGCGSPVAMIMDQFEQSLHQRLEVNISMAYGPTTQPIPIELSLGLKSLLTGIKVTTVD